MSDRDEKPTVFQLGRAYRFGEPGCNALRMAIRAMIWTYFHGYSYLGELSDGTLRPVGMDSTAAQYWHEIPMEEFPNGPER